MPYNRAVGGAGLNGNNIIYPIQNPSTGSKLYREEDVDAIARVLGDSLKISEMAGAVKTVVDAAGVSQLRGSLNTLIAEGSIVEYEEVT